MLGSVKTNNKKIDFKMKIGILTLIGEYNYGNLLQSYALQVILQRLGYESITLNRRSKSPTIKLRIIRIISFVKSLILRYVFRNKGRLIVNPFVENYSPKTFSDKTELKRFIKEYIKTMYVLKKQKGEIRVTDIADKIPWVDDFDIPFIAGTEKHRKNYHYNSRCFTTTRRN